MQLSPRSVSLVELEASEPAEARRMEEARTRACDNLCPEVNTHTFLSQSIGWCGSLHRKLASHTKKHTNKVKLA